MGQAKQQGSGDKQGAKARKRMPPTPGLYVSTKGDKPMRLVVEDVDFVDQKGAELMFYVSTIEEAHLNNLNKLGDELDQDQWYALEAAHGLQRQD